MPVFCDGQSYYRTAEVCRMVGISRNTLFRWLKEGVIVEPARRDWRGWRLFNQAQVDRLKGKTNQTIETERSATATDPPLGESRKAASRPQSANKREMSNTCLIRKLDR
jgi:excisionase family DNA binding protein